MGPQLNPPMKSKLLLAASAIVLVLVVVVVLVSSSTSVGQSPPPPTGSKPEARVTLGRRELGIRQPKCHLTEEVGGDVSGGEGEELSGRQWWGDALWPTLRV